MAKRRSVRRYGGSRRYKRPLAERCKDAARNFIAFMFSNVGIIGLVVGYTVAGAFIFQSIEGNLPPDPEANMAIVRNSTAEKLWELYMVHVFEEDKWKKLAVNELETFTEMVTAAVRDGYDGSDEPDEQKWAFPGAFLYSLTVITTIGYGNVSPKTAWGKIVTIIYAIIGMPLFLLYLSNIGDILARCFKWLYSRCCLCQWCPGVARKREERRKTREVGLSMQDVSGQPGGSQQWQMRHLNPYLEGADAEGVYPVGDSSEAGDDAEDDVTVVEDYDAQTVTVPITICLTIMVGYVCGGALLFSKYEGWDFLNGSYFCFISLSTIGFGDIVPGDKTYGAGADGGAINISFVLCSMYLMLGMALIAMCFNLMQEEVIHKIRRIVRTIRRIFR